MKKALKVLLIVVLVFAVIIGSLVLYMTRGLKTGVNLALSGIDPSGVSDGTYTGIYAAGRWSNKVSVTVKDGKITEITLIDDVTFAKEETTNEILTRVIQEQSTTVDAVSGGTVTSKAYLKAIENALNEN